MLGPFVALAAVVFFFGVTDSWMNGDKATFWTPRNVTTITAQTATVAVAALGMTIIIIAGGIDLSAGTSIALCAVVLAWCLKEDVATKLVAGDNIAGATAQFKAAKDKLGRIDLELKKLGEKNVDKTILATKLHEQGSASVLVEQHEKQLVAVKSASQLWSSWSPALALLAALGCGAACGFVNGALVSWLQVVPFIVTLGTMQLYLGLAKQIAHETTVRPERATQVPDWIANLLSVRPDVLYLGLPSGVWLTLLLAVLLAAALKWTVFSRYVFAIGSNEATARLCGINVTWNKIAVYTIAGLFVGIAGLYQFSRMTVGNPTSGSELGLRIIAAVVIGGGSLNGGRGTVLGTLTGALITSVITSGCTALGLRNYVQDMIIGIAIVAAVTLDQLRQKRTR